MKSMVFSLFSQSFRTQLRKTLIDELQAFVADLGKYSFAEYVHDEEAETLSKMINDGGKFPFKVP